MSDLRDDTCVLWCRRCKALVGVAPDEEAREQMEREHDAAVHAEPLAQTQFSRTEVKA